jgi:hypothetical protein
MANNIDMAQAIKAINPSAEFRYEDDNYETIQWLNETTPISKAEIEAKMNEMANEPEQSNYAQQRRNAYPEIGDQLDMLWHTIDKDEKLQGKYFDFYQTLKTVKVKFPKK